MSATRVSSNKVRDPRDSFGFLVGLAVVTLALAPKPCAGRPPQLAPECGNAVTPVKEADHPPFPAYYRSTPGATRVIVFVHGITGNGKSSWTAKNGTYWPALVASDRAFDGFDIYVAEYPTSPFGTCMSIPDVATRLQTYLAHDGVFAHREVIFVGHSMGGLIIRALLLQYRDLVSSVAALVFLGTPTMGSATAEHAAHISRCRQLDDMARIDINSFLKSQQNQWMADAKLSHVPTYCGFEEKTRLGSRAVTRESATALCNKVSQSLFADHSGVVKPLCNRSDSHLFLAQVIRDLPPNPAAPAAPPAVRAAQGSPVSRSVLSSVLTVSPVDPVAALVDSMTVEELVGQTLMVGVSAAVDDGEAELLELIATAKVGGVALYEDSIRPLDGAGENPDAPEAIAALTRRLQSQAYANAPDGRRLPLFIATDQEGGLNMRVESGVARVPAAMYIGATRNQCFAFEAGRAIGEELRQLGFNMVFAPVADLNNNTTNTVIGMRAFGAHPAVVTPLATGFARGLQMAGVAAVEKHFPGHGNSGDDPHFVLPLATYADWSQLVTETGPFTALFRNGWADGVMTSHILVKPLDFDQPVTLSQKAVAGFLRNDLSYDGVVITDDITEMTGILLDETRARVRTREDVVLQAYEAGHDIVLLGRLHRSEGEKLRSGVEAFSIPEFRRLLPSIVAYFSDPGHPERLASLKKSVYRIARLKGKIVSAQRFGGTVQWQSAFDPDAFDRQVQRDREVAEAVAREAVVLVSEDGRFVENPERDAKYFRKGKGPLSRGMLREAGDRIVIASAMRLPSSVLSDELSRKAKIPRGSIVEIPMVYGWSSEREEEGRKIWAKRVLAEHVLYVTRDWKTGVLGLRTDRIDVKVQEIVRKSQGARVLIFTVVTFDQVEILRRVAEQLRGEGGLEIVVLLFREPYSLPLGIYEQRNVIVLEVSLFPNLNPVVDVLVGAFIPKGIGYLPFSIEPRVRRDLVVGVAVTPCDDERMTKGVN